MHASHSSNVTANRPTANGLDILTEYCGPSSLMRPSSLTGEPMAKLPGGTATISGHLAQSLKMSPRFTVWAKADELQKPMTIAPASAAARRMLSPEPEAVG